MHPHKGGSSRLGSNLQSVDVIVSHTNTDFDALGAMLAARRLYPGAAIALSGSLNRNVREFYRLHADDLELVEAGRLDLAAIRRLIVVETVHPERLGELEPVARDPAVEVVVFDHHAGEAPDWVKPENLVLSEDGALTTTMVGILAEREIAVTPLEATVFALGIHEDTGSLGYPDVGVRDAEALAWCLRHGALQDVVAQYLRTPLSEEERALLDALVSSLEAHERGGCRGAASRPWPGRSTSTASRTSLTRSSTSRTRWRSCASWRWTAASSASSARACPSSTRPRSRRRSAGAAIRRPPRRCTAARSRRRASSSSPRSRGRPVRCARRPRSCRARRASSGRRRRSPRRWCCASATARAGSSSATRGSLVGHVTRENLDQAIGHGLSHAPVKSVMSTEVATCSEEHAAPRAHPPAPQLGRRSRRRAAPRTRSSASSPGATCCSALGELRVEEAAPAGPDLSERLLALPGLEPVFEAVQAVGEGFEGVYLVGGAVRDLLMDEPSFDVDIAVEGDGIAFGRALAKALGGRVVPHDKFGTAVVIHDGGRVDVATARTEFYDYPGALPAVEQASIRQDLYRRDFTINALAVSLKGEDFGRVVDFFGGLADLEAGVLRVLHNLSFIDDPTRLFRALRYENRYGFRMEAHTQGLARACVEMELVGELSSARLRDELEALLSEAEVAGTLRRLAELRLDEAIHPHLAAGEDAVALVAELDAPARAASRRRRRSGGRGSPRWRAACLRTSSTTGSSACASAAATPTGSPTRSPWRRGSGSSSRARTSPRRCVRSPSRTTPTACSWRWPGADAEVRSRLERYFGELRDVRLEISGADLAELGLGESPQVGVVLDEVLRRKLNGELAGRDAELAAARELVGA